MSWHMWEIIICVRDGFKEVISDQQLSYDFVSKTDLPEKASGVILVLFLDSIFTIAIPPLYQREASISQ